MGWEFFSGKYQEHLLSYSEIYGTTWYDMWKSKTSAYTMNDIKKELDRVLKIYMETKGDYETKMAGNGILRILAEMIKNRIDYKIMDKA